MRTYLVTDESTIARVAAVRQHALAQRRDMITMLREMGKDELTPGNDERFCVDMPDGWKVVYTIEQQQIGWCQHLSASVLIYGKQIIPPLKVFVAGVLPLFNLRMDEVICVWPEDIENGRAINLLFKYDGPLP